MPRPVRKGKKVQSVAACHSGRCEEHVFSLKPISTGMASRLECRLEFCPKYNSLTKKFRSLLPMLNRDGKEYTPCFILDGDEMHYSEHDDKYRQAHIQKITYYMELSNKTIVAQQVTHFTPLIQLTYFEPKHGRKSKICAVCRCEYEDYRDHINSIGHKTKIRVNPFNGYIDELVYEMQFKNHQMMDYSQSKDYSPTTLRSTCSNLSSDSYISKKCRKEMKMRDKQIEKNNRWLGYLPSYKCCSVFVREGIYAEDCRTTNMPAAVANKSFQVEDYLNLV